MQILWISKNTFLSNMAERVSKKQGWKFYSVDEFIGSAYLVPDLNPDIIFSDEITDELRKIAGNIRVVKIPIPLTTDKIESLVKN